MPNPQPPSAKPLISNTFAPFSPIPSSHLPLFPFFPPLSPSPSPFQFFKCQNNSIPSAPLPHRDTLPPPLYIFAKPTSVSPAILPFVCALLPPVVDSFSSFSLSSSYCSPFVSSSSPVPTVTPMATSPCALRRVPVHLPVPPLVSPAMSLRTQDLSHVLPLWAMIRARLC